MMTWGIVNRVDARWNGTNAGEIGAAGRSSRLQSGLFRWVVWGRRGHARGKNYDRDMSRLGPLADCVLFCASAR
jgi:hypothetical protein